MDARELENLTLQQNLTESHRRYEEQLQGLRIQLEGLIIGPHLPREDRQFVLAKSPRYLIMHIAIELGSVPGRMAPTKRDGS
jgi:hypothetical protein